MKIFFTAGSDADPYAPGPDDDPCPLEGIDINCSTSCGPRDAICDQLECNTATNPVPTLITSTTKFPFIIRVPAKPRPKCTKCAYAPPMRSTR